MGDFEQLVAELDQVTTGLENHAKLLGAYFRALKGEGFPEELAGYIVRDQNLRMLYPDEVTDDGEFNP